jgi:LacI family transcriptional regulator
MATFDRIKASGIPIVFFDKVPEDNNYVKVCLADREVGKLAARTIFEKKKKKVFALFGNPNMSITRKRKQGLVDELKKLSPFVEIATATANNAEEAMHASIEIFNSKSKPDLIFCMSDEILTGVIMAVHKKGLKIPKDVGVLAVSNGFIPKLCNPEITYIETSGTILGKRAMKTFMDVLEKGITKKMDVIESKLVEGGSI